MFPKNRGMPSSPRAHVEDLQRIEQSLGVRPGRVDEYRKMLLKLENAIARGQLGRNIDEITMRDAHEAIYSLRYLHLAVSAFATRNDFVSKVRTAFGGAALCRNDANSQSRNIEFELICVALLEKNGIKCIAAEPDLVFEFSGERIGLAAKRLRSKSQIKKRFAEGVKESRKQNIPSPSGNGIDASILALSLPLVCRVWTWIRSCRRGGIRCGSACRRVPSGYGPDRGLCFTVSTSTTSFYQRRTAAAKFSIAFLYSFTDPI